MFSFMINFMVVAMVMGEVFGVVGIAAGIAKIYLYNSNIQSTGGELVSKETIAEGRITLNDIEFSYPSKKDVKVID